MSLTGEQAERYRRQIILPEVGEDGQARLLAGKVLIVGAGGLGSPVALYLAAAGVGTIGIADADEVELSNLQRQVLHSTADLGRPKVASTETRLQGINPHIDIRTYRSRLTADNARGILCDYDFIVDATDNFPSKFLIADACHFVHRPYSHGGISGFAGQTMTVKPAETACYRCVFDTPPPEDPPPSPAQKGVMGIVPGMIGTLQATEAIKFLLGVGKLLVNTLLIYDALHSSFRKVPLRRNAGCPLCGSNPTIASLVSDT